MLILSKNKDKSSSFIRRICYYESMRSKQSGFHLVEVGIVLIVVLLLAALAYVFVSKTNLFSTQQDTMVKTSDGATTMRVAWQYDESARQWTTKNGQAPECREPFKFDISPVDLTHATSTLLPGQYRGFNYKPHGGFGFDESTNGGLEVKVPIDATMVGMKRYLEGDPAELQYMVTFETDCGIAFRFDHLRTLSPAFQAIANTTPEPKLNDTRSNPEDDPDPVAFKAGEVVATKIGFETLKRYGFDFGVYDYRQRNEISGNSEWAALHQQYTAQEWHGVCWFNMLPGSDGERAQQLSEASINTQKPNLVISDYCPNAKHSTLDFNGGKPTEG